MKAIWKRIHAWLRANAPEGYGQLRPGASAEEIEAAEQALGLKLPADVKASYRLHDGQGNEPGLIGGEGWCLLSLQDMVEWWRRWSRSDSRFANRVPIAWGVVDDVIFLELGQEAEQPGSLIVQRRDSQEPDPVAPSFRSWLGDFADMLEDDEFAYSEEHGGILYADDLDLE